MISVARIVRTQGLRGEVRVELTFEDDRNFEPGRRLQMSRGAEISDVEVESFRRQHGRCVLKLKGTDSIDAAEKLVGAELRISPEAIGTLESGWFYTFQLKGCEVYENGEHLGVVTEILDMGGNELLKVERDAEEILIPFAKSYLKRVDVASRRIDVELPEGLRELNR